MNENEQDILVCAPWADDGQHIPGTVRNTCTECGQGVSIAPSGQQLLVECNLRVVCVTCAMEAMREAHDKGEKVEVAPLRPEQTKEIAEAIIAEAIHE